MANLGTREGRPPEGRCCEEGCDRPAAQGDVRCEYHVLRLGGRLLAPAPGPRAMPVVDVPVLDAIAPTKGGEPPGAPPKRAGPRLAGAAVCQVLGLASVAALIETCRFEELDDTGILSLPNLALFAVPYSNVLNLYAPLAGWVALTAGQLVLAVKGRRAAEGRWGRGVGVALFAGAILTTLAALGIVGEPVHALLLEKLAR